jgi:hypothetical protein
MKFLARLFLAMTMAGILIDHGFGALLASTAIIPLALIGFEEEIA